MFHVIPVVTRNPTSRHPGEGLTGWPLGIDETLFARWTMRNCCWIDYDKKVAAPLVNRTRGLPSSRPKKATGHWFPLKLTDFFTRNHLWKQQPPKMSFEKTWDFSDSYIVNFTFEPWPNTLACFRIEVVFFITTQWHGVLISLCRNLYQSNGRKTAPWHGRGVRFSGDKLLWHDHSCWNISNIFCFSLCL